MALQLAHNNEGVEPEFYRSATIFFSNIVGFVEMSARCSPLEVVDFLNQLYTLFDAIVKDYDVYKVETIVDGYMVVNINIKSNRGGFIFPLFFSQKVSGVPERNGDLHAANIAAMALDLLQAVGDHFSPHWPEGIPLRIGIHTGEVIAGVVGLTRPRYCLYGDTVNTASRMLTTGEALRIHISDECCKALARIGGFVTEERGVIAVKGKGRVLTHWLVSDRGDDRDKKTA